MPITFAFHNKRIALPTPGDCLCSRKEYGGSSSFARLPAPPPPAALLELPRQGVEMLSGSFTNLANWFNKKTDASVNGDGGALTDHESLVTQPLSVVVFGATGDLARKKLFPALYQLCVLGRFPRDLKIVACGRQLVDRDAFLSRQLVNVREDARFSLADFSACIQLHAGGYDALEAYVKLNEHLRRYERTQHEAIGSGQSGGNRLFVLAVPSTCFGPICEHIATYARAAEADSESGAGGGFTRVLVEKPFGHDAASFASLHQLT
jgi:hypothetical protein